MKNQNKILDFEDILNTYSTKIPHKQLKLLKSRHWLPIEKNSIFAQGFKYSKFHFETLYLLLVFIFKIKLIYL